MYFRTSRTLVKIRFVKIVLTLLKQGLRYISIEFMEHRKMPAIWRIHLENCFGEVWVQMDGSPSLSSLDLVHLLSQALWCPSPVTITIIHNRLWCPKSENIRVLCFDTFGRDWAKLFFFKRFFGISKQICTWRNSELKEDFAQIRPYFL